MLQLNKVQKSLNGIDSEKEKLNEAVEQAKKRLTEISSELMGNRIVLESLQKENDFVTIDEANRVQETARKNKDEKADDYKDRSPAGFSFSEALHPKDDLKDIMRELGVIMDDGE